jgi:lysophospholipase L1-like esterase
VEIIKKVKTLMFLAALVLILCSCTVHGSSQQVLTIVNSTAALPNPATKPAIDNTDSFSAGAGGNNLGRTFTKLKNKGNITIAFLGGSITGGAGASDPKNAYSALVSQWFQDQFPSKTITNINAGIGGTGSDLGAFRVFFDVGKADLVFIEFAVNDDAPASERDQVMKYTEGMVRRLFLANPQIEIVFVDLASEETSNWYKNGEVPPVVKWHREIADHYSISEKNAILYINPGYDLVEYIKSGQGSWTGGKNPMTTDSVHPNDNGHKFIAGKIIAALQQSYSHYMPLPKFKPLPASISLQPVQNGNLVEIGKGSRSSGWSYVVNHEPGWSTSELQATENGATLDFNFTGEYIGIFLVQTEEGGSFEAWVDDGAVQLFSTQGPFTRRDIVMVSENAGKGKHRLHIKITALPVKFLSFMVNP